MKVNAFITIFNTRVKRQHGLIADDMMEIIKDIIKPIPYISYDNKLKIIDQTIQDSKQSDHVTADRNRFFIINLINAYTNLDVDVNGFDTLSENQLLDIIVATFESEFHICNNLMQMCLSDLERW